MLDTPPSSATEAQAKTDAKAQTPETGAAAAETPHRKAKKTKQTVPKARACICAGENNTIISITDMDGKVLAWASSGSSGFKGTRKSTPYAAKVAAERVMTMVQPFGIQAMQIEVKGIGPGREQAIRGLQVAGVNFDAIIDRTPIAHGGCRKPKPRRV